MTDFTLQPPTSCSSCLAVSPSIGLNGFCRCLGTSKSLMMDRTTRSILPSGVAPSGNTPQSPSIAGSASSFSLSESQILRRTVPRALPKSQFALPKSCLSGKTSAPLGSAEAPRLTFGASTRPDDAFSAWSGHCANGLEFRRTRSGRVHRPPSKWRAPRLGACACRPRLSRAWPRRPVGSSSSSRRPGCRPRAGPGRRLRGGRWPRRARATRLACTRRRRGPSGPPRRPERSAGAKRAWRVRAGAACVGSSASRRLPRALTRPRARAEIALRALITVVVVVLILLTRLVAVLEEPSRRCFRRCLQRVQRRLGEAGGQTVMRAPPERLAYAPNASAHDARHTILRA